MANTLRSIQFRRNQSVIYDSKQQAQEAILNNKDAYNDGEQIFGRYYKTNESSEKEVRTLVGLVYVNEEDGNRVVNITFSDASDVDEKIEELSGTVDTKFGELSGKTITSVTIDRIKSNPPYTSGNSDSYQLQTETATGEVKTDTFRLYFTPYSPNELKVPETIGDIMKGTTAEELSTMTISKILDDIIFPTKYPALTSHKGYTAINGLSDKQIVIVGRTMPQITGTYVKGTAIVKDGVTPAKYWTGELTNPSFTQTFASGTTANTPSENARYLTAATSMVFDDISSGHTSDVVTPTNTQPSGHTTCSATGTPNNFSSGAAKFDGIGTYTFKFTGSYGEGDKLITSKNSNPGSPLKYESLDNTLNTTATTANPNTGGTVESNSVTIRTTLPIFITETVTEATADPVYTEQRTLVEWGKSDSSTGTSDISNSWIVNLPGTTDENPIRIKTPRKLKSFSPYNVNDKVYVANDISKVFSFQEIEQQIGGVNYKYYEYTWIGPAVARFTYKINWL